MYDDLQKRLEEENVTEEASNAAIGQISSGTMEVNQTNVVKYYDKLTSIAVEEKNIQKIKEICRNAEEPHMPAAEICLSISSLFAGAFFSAIISGIQMEFSWKAIVFYILCPMIAVGCGVAFFFLRHNEQISVNTIAIRILENLPETESEKKRTEYES